MLVSDLEESVKTIESNIVKLKSDFQDVKKDVNRLTCKTKDLAETQKQINSVLNRLHKKINLIQNSKIQDLYNSTMVKLPKSIMIIYILLIIMLLTSNLDLISSLYDKAMELNKKELTSGISKK